MEQFQILQGSFKNFSQALQGSVDNSRNLIRNLEERCLFLESQGHQGLGQSQAGPPLVTPPKAQAPIPVDQSALWVQTNKTLGIVLGRMQILDKMVMGMDKKVRDNENNCLTAHRSIIPKQRIEKIEEDMRIVAEVLSGLDEFENSLRDIRKRVHNFEVAQKMVPPKSELASRF